LARNITTCPTIFVLTVLLARKPGNYRGTRRLSVVLHDTDMLAGSYACGSSLGSEKLCYWTFG